jgi:N-acyl amino acid synthase of PEP-CTERM/exosortase system
LPFFQYKKITPDDARINEIYRLRYKVYCLECGYEDACDYINHLETDEYDQVATHFCACESKSGKIIGTARIILPSATGLPLFNHFPVDRELLLSIPSDSVAEISRLAISKEYRQRMVDEAIYGDNVVSLMGEREKRNWRKRYENELVTGLYHCIYAESIELGLTHLYAIMSDGLYALLTRWGLVCHPIGPALDHHGIRRPYIASIAENMSWFETEQKRISLG